MFLKNQNVRYNLVFQKITRFQSWHKNLTFRKTIFTLGISISAPKTYKKLPPRPPSKKSLTWDEEVEQTWTEFKTYINHKENYTSEDIINYLTYTMHARKIAVSTMVNLKARLSIAYR